MQAAGLLKEKTAVVEEFKGQCKAHRPMAKPVLVASITQENANSTTLIEEAKDGMSWITSHVKLPNGKGAWNEADETRKSSRRRGGSKNKVGDASLATKAEDQNTPNGQNGVVNILLYVGFALVGLGLILTFVGMGERGFKTNELKLIGPSLIGCGVLFTILRILFCSFACNPQAKPLDKKALLSPSQETLEEDRQTTPPIPITKKIRRPSPIKTAVAKVRQVKPLTKTSPERSDSPMQQTIPNFIEDEVESDADLGLDVQYVDDKPKASSRAGTAKSTGRSMQNDSGPPTAQLTSRQDIPTLDSSFNNGEVLLDPSKLNINNG